jgi:anti-sigma factor RsiW
MNTVSCLRVAELLDTYADSRLPAAQRTSVDAHVAQCPSCARAWEAVLVLRAERNAQPPRPRPELYDHALRLAVQCAEQARPQERRQGRFWLGAAFGGALAASLVAGLLAFMPLDRSPAPAGTAPELLIALNDTRDMNVAIQSARSVAAAQIHVTVTGAVAVAGYEDLRELSWATELDSGVNMLTLPVRMQGPEGGSVLVEVSYEGKQKTFAVQVRSAPLTPADLPV